MGQGLVASSRQLYFHPNLKVVVADALFSFISFGTWNTIRSSKALQMLMPSRFGFYLRQWIDLWIILLFPEKYFYLGEVLKTSLTLLGLYHLSEILRYFLVLMLKTSFWFDFWNMIPWIIMIRIGAKSYFFFIQT